MRSSSERNSNTQHRRQTGGGGVFRRNNGTWVCGFSIKFHAINPVAAELLGIREELNIAKDMHLSTLELEVDAQWNQENSKERNQLHES